jgi:Asp-tRNA(Asn)/Glu-tRNA(Gln) amidotransferase A subunit family amidase
MDLEKEHADYIKKLLALGAIVVGKTMMTSFASADEPTNQSVDRLYVSQ